MAVEFPTSHAPKMKRSVLEGANPRIPERTTITPIGEYTPGVPLEHYVVRFPGIGSPQIPDRNSPLRKIPLIDSLYTAASANLGQDLSRLSNRELRLVGNAVPAFTLLNIASSLSHELAFPQELKNEPEVVVGQGEMLSAAWFAGVFGERQSMDAIMLALELSQTRGEIMQIACNPPYPKTGTILISAGHKKGRPDFNDYAAIEVLRQETMPRERRVSLALDVSDAEIVVGGTKSDLVRFYKENKQRFKDLDVDFYHPPTESGAQNTKYMEVIEDEIRKMYESIQHLLHKPNIPLLTNTYERPKLIRTVAGLIEEEVRLCTQPVYGRAMEKYLADKGINSGLEFGNHGIIANSLDKDFFEMTPRKAAVAGTILATGAVITTAIFINRKGKR